MHPQFTPTPTYLPVSMRYNLAPGQAPAIAPLLPALVAPPAPRTNSITSLSLVRETRMLDYGVWTSGFGCAPKFDSAGSTDGGYHRAASRAAGRERVKRWEKGLVAPEPLPRIRVDDPATSAAASADEFVLTKDERTTLEGMEVEIEQFLKFTRQAQDDEAKVWRVLERNLELIQRLGTAQIARTRKGVKKEERRRKAEIKKTTAAAAAATTNGVDGGDEEVREEGRRDLAEGVEKQDGQFFFFFFFFLFLRRSLTFSMAGVFQPTRSSNLSLRCSDHSAHLQSCPRSRAAKPVRSGDRLRHWFRRRP